MLCSCLRGFNVLDSSQFLLFHVMFVFQTSMTKKKKEKERCQLLIDKLREEQQQQLEHNRCVKKWLETKKEGWFPSSKFV